MFLEKMGAIQKERVREIKARHSVEEMEEKTASLPPPRDFLGAIRGNHPMALIAEIKRASPSAGAIREETNLQETAQIYQREGAAAISVLTEPQFFHGSMMDLRQVRRETSLPLLQKDFIIDAIQIYEGRLAGADAVLLIAALLEREQIGDLAQLAGRLGMAPLVEIHDEEDLRKIGDLKLPLLGINNRNLRTLEVNLNTTLRLVGQIPSETTIISESGIRRRQDVEDLQKMGVRGILVGEVFMRAVDPASKIRELLGR
jgi:indole-3-glycerol phosphate synthase